VSDLRRDSLQQLQHLSADGELAKRKSGDVTAGPSQTGNNAAANWIGDPLKYNRDSTGHPLQRGYRQRTSRHDDVGLQANQFGGSAVDVTDVGTGPAILHLNIVAS
jgi:hypothetical protein